MSLKKIMLLLLTVFTLAGCKPVKNSMDAFFKLSAPEKWWVLTHLYQAPKAWTLTITARKETKTLRNTSGFANDTEKGALNAFEHAYWMAMLSSSLGTETAYAIGKAHEKGDLVKKGLKPFSHVDIDYKMDTWNNKVGISIGANNEISNRALLKQSVMDSLCNGKLMIIKKCKLDSLIGNKMNNKGQDKNFQVLGDSINRLIPSSCP